MGEVVTKRGEPDMTEAPAAVSGQSTILVVDDESGIRRGCERVLRVADHEVLTAASAEEALEILAEHPDVDLTLVDLKLPGMGGLDFLSQTCSPETEMVCVVITAYATIESAIEATKRGAYDFLTKPFTPDELARVVGKSLERVRLVRERNRLQAERERRMLELATEQSRLRTVINCMTDAVLVTNSDGELVLYNPAALRVLPNLSPGTSVCLLRDAVKPDELCEIIAEASDHHKRISREVNLTGTVDAGWVQVDVAPVLDENSRTFLGTVAVLGDITELKRVEEVKAQFVNMVAHELRAPLAAIDGYMSVILEGLVEDPQKQREMLNRSRDRLGALLDLVGDLLDVSRMEAGTVRREIAPQSIPEIIGEVVELMQPMAAERKIAIMTDIDADLTPIEADREELIRLFTNLTSNAIKYNRPDGRVVIAATQAGPYVKVDVADTGVGISEDGQKELFTEFFREKRPETSYVTGTGLGLSIVKRIVDFYHGRVAVGSQVGRGSTFSIWLPCSCITESTTHD